MGLVCRDKHGQREVDFRADPAWASSTPARSTSSDSPVRSCCLRFGTIFLGSDLNSLLWWLVVALPFVLLLAVSLFGFFFHLSEFLLLFGRKDGLNLRSRSLMDLLHLFSLLVLSQ